MLLPPSILLVGETASEEFRQAVTSLREGGDLVELADVPRAIAHLQRNSPELVVLAQRWPGEFTDDEVDRLHRAAPLARFSALLGSWCEGEARSGRPWPAVTRAYWHEWPARFGQELARISAGQCPSWGLPVTARDEERMLAAAEEPLARRGGLIVVVAEQAASAASLVDACRLRGYATIAVRAARGVTICGAAAALWDTTAEQATNVETVAAMQHSCGGAPLIALLNFPCAPDIAAAQAAGVPAVLSKPWLLDDLYWQLDRVQSLAP